MDTYTIPVPESGNTAFTRKDWEQHGRPPILILEEGWTMIDNAFYGAEDLLRIRIPASVIRIVRDAFALATKLHQVAFVEGSRLRFIQDFAFSGATSLERINIPKNVENIGYSAFSNTTSLREVTFEEGSKLKNIEDAAFIGATSLERINIPKNVEIIGDSAFSNTTSLREVTFEEGSKLQCIGDAAFASATSLKTIRIPANLNKIENGAFSNTPMLTEITFEPNFKFSSIYWDAFRGSGLTTLVMGEPVLARLNATRRASNQPPLSFGKNNFYGKNNVNIVSMAQQIDTMHLIKSQLPRPIDNHVTNKIGEMLTGLTPKRSDLVKGPATKGMGGTRKRGIRRKSNKRKMKTKKGKSKRRMTRK
jgi:hypothetical protein